MDSIPLPFPKINLFLFLCYLSNLAIGPFSRILSLEIDRALSLMEGL